MEIKAQLNYLRIAPRKVRVVADTIRGKMVGEAETALKFLERGAKTPIKKLLNSAVANARHNFSAERDKLFVKSIRVDKGPTLKRFMPRARGSASPINKRTSHITIILDIK
ncbi:50S ribosomal protein L22 [Candidatus Giovannonibacteria bacterium]|nr:50S ribosomal protein L22 [Candidatus Giovannonibacteria bacterium]